MKSFLLLVIAALCLSSCRFYEPARTTITGEYQQIARLAPLDRQAGDLFGYFLALSGDNNTIAVGSALHDNSGVPQGGAVFVYRRTASGWRQEARIMVSRPTAKSYFGISVALSYDGNALVAGRHFETNNRGEAAGNVYIFHRDGTLWKQIARLQAGDEAAGDHFGTAVALTPDGKTLAAGAYHAAVGGLVEAGRAYIFADEGGVWTQRAELVSGDPTEHGDFGVSLAFSDNSKRLAISSYGAANSAGLGAGNVYVFDRVETGWRQQARLQASNAVEGMTFGTRVALSADGTVLATGAYHAERSAGYAYVFVERGGKWTEQARLRPADNAAGDAFGSSVGLTASGDLLIVGSDNDNHAGGWNKGNAYVFKRAGAQWRQITRLEASQPEDGDFGEKVVLSRDGSLVVVGAYGDNNTPSKRSGAAYVFTRRGAH